MEKHHIIPVWFFVGLLLAAYGALICFSGVMEYSHPPNTVLAELHAPVWWGAIMVVVGGIYIVVNRPK
jgi:hypothetical protein